MVEFKVKHRETGALATLAERGKAVLTTPTGGTLDVVTAASEPGFNPVDLMCASLASCLVLSIKGAVVKLHLLDAFEGAEVSVKATKAHQGPSRIERLDAEVSIIGNFNDAQRSEIVKLSKELCTISNTLVHMPDISIRVADLNHPPE